MQGQDEPLFSIVSKEPEKLVNVLGHSLSTIKQASVRYIAPAEMATESFSAHEILIVDFVSLGSIDAVEYERILPAECLMLGLLPKDKVASPSDDMMCCAEVVAWPGDDKEVVAKLSRLCRLTATDSRIEQALTLKLNLVGESKSFQRIIQNVTKYSKCDAPVLILGETGTGKEQIARAIHYLGLDDGKPFIAVNCGALPDNLVENELFGHVKGAYTDAKESQCGLVEQAEGGTLFLDEIESLTQKGQVALLRFLQDYEYRPLGAQRSRKARLRLITASNEPLEQLIDQGVFRKDLFYRLNILSLQLPPLRERGVDVILLAEHFVDKYRDIYQQFDKYIDPETLKWLSRYDWPGNVRELENLILREFLLAESACISVEPLTNVTGERRRNGLDRRCRHLFKRSFQEAKGVVVNEFERGYLQHVLEDAGGNISEAARQAGKERRTFAKLLDKHGICKKQFGRDC